ncbi:SMP-30/gluconolactonase/LRE family protein [Nonlabens antarcticus]|uniref:SMP-30/gluconolactonase/LRE family protein n=1 Tax=Nonlabens antarcticus TaxID=392714 RepID=UPI001890FA2E|nr:SMP-30/gluconolactonase/LRE family protein [Nonlabens antarcticus]
MTIRFLIISLALFSGNVLCAQNDLDFVSKYNLNLVVEIPDLAHVESVAFDASTQLLYASIQGNQEPGDGSIVTFQLDGSMEDIAFTTGLNNPKGIAIYKNKLYVSDVTELVEIDLQTGNILNRFSTGTEQFLNDVAIDADGNVYVSDMGSSSIYKLETDGKFTNWLSSPKLENPNGLLVKDNTLFIAAWGLPDKTNNASNPQGRFLKVDLTTKIIDQVTETPQGNLDGLQVLDDQNFLISDWRKGTILKISKSGVTELFFTSKISVGDILYLQKEKLLVIPLNRQNKVEIYKITD